MTRTGDRILSAVDDSTIDLVLIRAAIDGAFRAAVLADPHQAITGAFGRVVPERLRLRFIEKEPGIDLMVVLPDLVEGDRPIA